MKNHCRFVLSIAVVLFLTLTTTVVKASPYASGVTNNNGTIQFYLNESGGSVTVTYEDGSTNSTFDGVSMTATNLPSGPYSFSLSGHTSYNIAVTKYGSGIPGLEANVIQATNWSVYTTNWVLEGFGDVRGLAVNVHPTSPYFGRIYCSRGNTTSSTAARFYGMNSDGSWITGGAGGGAGGANGSDGGYTSWSTEGHFNSPNRISIAQNDALVVGDMSSANAGVFLIGPNLTTNEVLLGPVGDADNTTVHGEEQGRPVLLGDPTTNATLFTIDAEFPSSAPGSILVYSNLTQSALPWETAPNLIGPEVTLDYDQVTGSGFYFIPFLDVRPDLGYAYSGEYRNAVNVGEPAEVQVYSLTNFAEVWNSRYNGGASDYFYTAAAGGTSYNPSDLAVSPDGKYLVAVGADNHFTVCSLTNGIPDVSTLYTIRPDRYESEGSYGSAAEVAWDAADNLYIASYYNYGVKCFTLGQSATYITSGNASGTTNFSEVPLNSIVSVSAASSFISQANTYGNPTNTSFIISRTGYTNSSITVNYSFSGTATGTSQYPVEYTASPSGSITLLPGVTSTNVTINAIFDTIPRPTTTLTITVSSSPTYALLASTASINILSTAPEEVLASVGAPSMYNVFSNDYASIVLTRWGDTNATAFTVGSFNLGGTAVQGVDYTAPTPATINPGDPVDYSYVYPLQNGQPPVDTNVLTYVGNKTIIASVPTGANYLGSTNTATLTILDKANPTATYLYYDPLTNSLDSNNWAVTSVNDNMQANAIDEYIDFAYDLYDDPRDPYASQGYGAVPIPFPPNGATNALRLTVNKTPPQGEGAAAAVNLYETNVMLSGNYAVRFNMNLVEGYASYYTTEGALFGINHGAETGPGTYATNWFAGSGLRSGWSPTETAGWESDGIWCWVSVDDGIGTFAGGPSDYMVFTGSSSTNATDLGAKLPNPGWAVPLVAQDSESQFANNFKTNVFTSPQGPGLAANMSPDIAAEGAGTGPDSSWTDVELKQFNNVVSIYIDKVRICIFTNVTTFTNGYPMLGYEDPYDSVGGGDAAVYYSNFRVVQLTAPAISETAYNHTSNTYVFDFTSTDGDATTASFKVVGATAINGPYTAVAGVTITQLSSGAFQASVPTSGPVHFYRIQQTQ